jgi:hypothetical protein
MGASTFLLLLASCNLRSCCSALTTKMDAGCYSTLACIQRASSEVVIASRMFICKKGEWRIRTGTFLLCDSTTRLQHTTENTQKADKKSNQIRSKPEPSLNRQFSPASPTPNAHRQRTNSGQTAMATSAAYPSSLYNAAVANAEHSQPNNFASSPQTAAGSGGVVAGGQNPHPALHPHFQADQPSPTPILTTRAAPPRPRPVSMPPQPYTPPNAHPQSVTQRPEERQQHRQHREAGPSTGSRNRSTNRILGDYTLSKTLGAGSMGKVKLATHNITGEKVSLSPSSFTTNRG